MNVRKSLVNVTGLDGLDELLGEVYMPPSGLGCQAPPQMITSLEEDEEMRQLLQDAAPPAADKEDCDNGNANKQPDWHSRPSQSWSAPLPSGIHSAYRNTSTASSAAASTTTTTSTSSSTSASSSNDNAAAASHLSSSCGSQSSSAGGGSSLFGELQQVVFNSLIASLES